MKFNNTKSLSFEEALHYMDLGLIEGVELPTDFVGEIDSRIQRAFDLGHEKASEDTEALIREAYNESLHDSQLEK